jgi:succinate-acetate transporter protein
MTHADGGVVTQERLQLHQTWTQAGPVMSHLPDAQVERLREMSEASIGEPGPMSLFGFAVGTLLIALPISSVMPLTTTLAAVPALLVFGGLAQFIGGLFAYRKGNTFAATAFCSFGANNVVVSMFFLLQDMGTFPKNNNTNLFLAIDLFCFAYIAFILFVASFKLNASFVLVLLALFPGYGLAACGNIASLPAVIGQIGGWFLICSAGLAFYAAGALAINSTYERTILPMFPRASTDRQLRRRTTRPPMNPPTTTAEGAH